MPMFDDLKRGLNEIDTYLAGKEAGYKVTVPAEIDVKTIRKELHMTQAGFSKTFGFSLDAVKHWEGARRTPKLLCAPTSPSSPEIPRPSSQRSMRNQSEKLITLSAAPANSFSLERRRWPRRTSL
jgi:putative transcriptional regulator